jgi:ubiquinone/menaquinone biosynthesis C-methylase UbiE
MSDTKTTQLSESKDYLWEHIRSLPYFRSLLRSVEARFYENIELPSPTLDLGCGDGHFATVAFKRKIEVGIDPWGDSIHEAAKWGGYKSLAQADGAYIPFPNEYFSSAVSNSVLEHIPHIDDVLMETSRVLKHGALFIFCVPNDKLLPSLSIAHYLDQIKMHALANSYRAFFNRIARHHHADSQPVWQERLDRAGFHIESWWDYFSPSSTAVMEWGHYFGLPSLVTRKLFGRWILVPTHWNLSITYKYLKPYYQENPIRDDGTYTFYIARRN